MSKRSIKSRAQELLTLARLFESVHDYDEAARNYYALYAIAKSDDAAAETALSSLAKLMLNAPELEGLMSELLVSHERPRGTLRLDNWLLTHADTLGTKYASELDRHWR